MTFDIVQVGANISVAPFEWVNTKGFFGEVGTVFDIGVLNTRDVGGGLLMTCILNIKLSFGKNFYL